MTSLPPSRPLLRYHGGKWRIAPWIVSHLPCHRVYVEAFSGAASVLLRKRRAYAEVVNDLDGELVNLFRQMRDRGPELVEAIRLTPYARDEFALSYEPSPDPLEQARRTIVRSWFGYGSSAHSRKTGFRTYGFRNGQSVAGEFANWSEAAHLIVERLRGVILENRDAIEVMATHDSDETVHYVDPPYLASVRDAGRDYRHELTEAEHLRLLTFLKELRGPVVLSGYDSPLYRDALPGWRMVSRPSLADAGQMRVECLWLSPTCERGELPFVEQR